MLAWRTNCGRTCEPMNPRSKSPMDSAITPWWCTSRVWVGVMVVLHLVAVVGIALGHAEELMAYTPLNLVLCAGIVMAFTGSESPWRWGLTMFLGFAVEVIGVTTGLLFGSYSYGNGLGPKALGVPLLMGVLWWLLLMGTHHWAARWLPQGVRPVLRAAVAATAMTLLDALIEPVAIRAGWWSWQDGTIPWTNYLTWWLAAWAMGMLWRDVDDLKTNRPAGMLIWVFVVFFLILNILPWTLS